MSNSTKQVLCIFCDERGARAREDIIPRWIANELGGESPFFIDHGVVYAPDGGLAQRKTSRPGSLMALKLRDVCARCNNEWMSRLEERAKAVLLPMIRGRATVLDQTGQRIVAAWGQLKLISLDAFYRDRGLPPSSAHEFTQCSQPSGRLKVAVGELSDWSKGVRIPYTRWRWPTDPPADNTHPRLVRVVFGFGHLVVQVAQFEPQAGPGYNLTKAHDPTTLAQIWPQVTDQVRWPPPERIDLDSFNEIV